MSECSDEKLSANFSVDVLRPSATEKLATMNMVHSAMPRLVDLARGPNLNRSRERILDRRKMV
jgi:hypothetical protein